MAADISQLVVVGRCPDWLIPDIHIPGNQYPFSARNVFNNILSACRSELVEEDCIFMNDDFFLLRLWSPVPAKRGALHDHINRTPPGKWRSSLVSTQVMVKGSWGIEDPYSYELHIPLPAPKSEMLHALERSGSAGERNPPQWRSLWGNMFRPDASVREDVKIDIQDRRPWKGWDLVSAYPNAMPRVLQHTQHKFKDPSRWEK